MTTDLSTIFPDMEQSAKSLDWFISCRLFAAGAWDSPRVSDGVHRVRILERTPSTLRLGGWIWEISQALKPFWLDVEVADESIQWALSMDGQSDRGVNGQSDRPFLLAA